MTAPGFPAEAPAAGPRAGTWRTRLAQVRLLAGRSARLLAWPPAAGCTAMIAVVLVWPAGTDWTWHNGVWSLRMVALLVALGAVFALDDAAAELAAPAPIPLPVRTAIRLGAVLAWAGPVWALSLAVLARDLPAGWIAWSTLECAALLAIGLAVASVLTNRYGRREPGQLAVAALAGTWLLLFVLPGPLAMFTLREQDWTAAHLRWGALLVVALAVLGHTSRDPARTWRRTS